MSPNKMLDSMQLILYTMHIDLHSITGDNKWQQNTLIQSKLIK